MKTIVVFCHLRWDFVWQRPQHLLSRLACDYRIVFVEESQRCRGPAHVESRQVAPDIEVLRPHTPLASFGFADDQVGVIAPMLDELFAARRIERPVAWLYTPMALPLLDALEDDRCRAARLRLHGRALGLPRRAARAASAEKPSCWPAPTSC